MTIAGSEDRYKSIFWHAPIPLWEEDFTAVVAEIDALKAAGVRDFDQFFRENPQVLGKLAELLQILDVNPASLVVFEASSKEELLGSLDKVFSEDTYTAFQAQMVALANGEPHFSSEAYARTLRGGRVYVHTTLTMLPPQDGITRGLISIMDISRRKQAEDELAAQEKRYRTLIESIPHMIWMGDAGGKITYCNQAMIEMTGVRLDEAQGQDWMDSIRPLDPQAILELRERARDSRRSYGGEYKFRAADGTERSVYFIDTPVVDEQGAIVNWVSVNTDVTELKDMQEALQLSLDRSNLELSQIAHATSHDLQEPLRMVTSYAQLLQRRYREQLDDKADMYIDYLVEGAKRIRQLILDLRALSDVSREGKEMVPVDSSWVLDRVLEKMQSQLESAQASITRGELPTVVADPAQLAQVLEQLVDNSLKFRGDAPPRVHVTAYREGRHWRLAVKDNGRGFDARQYGTRVFQMFQRLNPRDQYPGTGIGLTLAKKIIERHGGRIWAESGPGEGATFFFTLPAVAMEVLGPDSQPR